MKHHDAVCHTLSLGDVVRYHHDASTTITQSHQFFFDGLYVEPAEVRSAFIEEQKRLLENWILRVGFLVTNSDAINERKSQKKAEI